MSVARRLRAGSHRNDYERIQLKTDLRLVHIIKSEGKPFHIICLKTCFQTILLSYFLRFIISPCLKPPPTPLVFYSLLCVNRPLSIMSQRFPHKIGHKIGHKTGHCYFCNRSEMHHLVVTQPDYERGPSINYIRI